MANDGSVKIGVELDDSKVRSQSQKVGHEISQNIGNGAKSGASAVSNATSQMGKAFSGVGSTAQAALGGDVSVASLAAGNALGTLAANGIMKVASAIETAASKIADFVSDSVQVGMEFDKAMSQVAATMGTTTDDIQELDAFAQEMGATTAFSATQAAEALNYMALAGYSAETSMDMLPTVLNLAAAGNLDLARASDMVTDAQSALGLSLDETRVMVDQMAMTSSKTNTSVGQLGDAFLTVGGTAKNLAGGTAELSQMLGILADNGIKGSEGGTAIRNVILSLTAPTDKAAAAIKDLGVSIFDAEGNMRDLPSVFNELNDAMADMTQQERTEILSEIFHKVDLKSANALLGTSAERFEEVAAAIDDAQGSAEKMANTQLDNLAGDVTLLRSAVEGFQISISRSLAPSLRDVVKTASEAFSGFKTAWDESMAAENYTGAGEALGQGLLEIVDEFVAILPQIFSMSIELLGGFILGLASNLPTFFTNIISSIASFSPKLIQAVMKIGVALVQALPTIMRNIVDAIPVLIDGLVSAFVESSSAFVVGFVELFSAVVKALPDIIEVLITAIPDLVAGLVVALLNNIDLLVTGFIELFLAFVTAIPDIITTIAQRVPEIVTAIGDSISRNAGRILEAFNNLFVEGVKGIPEAIPQALAEAGAFIGQVVGCIASRAGEMWNTANAVFLDFCQGIGATVSNGIAAAADFAWQVVSEIGRGFSDMWSIGFNLVSGIWYGISDAAGWIIGQIGGFCDRVKNAICNFFGIASPSKLMRDLVGKNIVLGMAVGIERNAGAVDDAVEGVADGIKSKLGGAWNSALDLSGRTIRGLSVGVSGGVWNGSVGLGAAQASAARAGIGFDYGLMADSLRGLVKNVDANVYVDGSKSPNETAMAIASKLQQLGRMGV